MRAAPKSKAARGDTTPEGIGRLRVRDISWSMSRSYQQLKTLAAPAANIPPTIVAPTSRQAGQPSAAIIIAGSVVTSSSSTSLGLVSATKPPTRTATADRAREGASPRSESAVTGFPREGAGPRTWSARGTVSDGELRPGNCSPRTGGVPAGMTRGRDVDPPVERVGRSAMTPTSRSEEHMDTRSTGPGPPPEAASGSPTGRPPQPNPTLPDGFGELDRRAIDTVRVLAMDAVQKVGNGHPGTAMSMAPTAYLLFQKWLRHDPTDANWVGRDRFVLSMGHSSLTLYLQLYLSGYGLELEDLEALRTWGSKTPGHPEVNHTPGVETTTGPLGQGVGNAVGMAMAARRERGLFDPDAPEGEGLFDHTIWCFASDGDLEEGVSGEASSLAGTQQLGNLVLVYDDNRISIEDDTNVAFTEDVGKRYEAYGWHVQHVDDGEDLASVDAAFAAAKAETTRPSMIVLRTVIAWPAPNKQNTGAAHGSALGDDEVRATKEVLGFDPKRTFQGDDEVLQHARSVVEPGRARRSSWDEQYAAWEKANPE